MGPNFNARDQIRLSYAFLVFAWVRSQLLTPWLSFCIFSPADQAAKLDHWAALGKKQAARPLRPAGVGKNVKIDLDQGRFQQKKRGLGF